MNTRRSNRLVILLMLGAMGLSAAAGCPAKPVADTNTPASPSAARNEPPGADSPAESGAGVGQVGAGSHASTEDVPAGPALEDRAVGPQAARETVGQVPATASDGTGISGPSSVAGASSKYEAATTSATESPLFVDWPKPTAAIVISGRQDGYMEPCGCTGLANQKGGLARRFTFIQQIQEERAWPAVAIDAGNQVRRFGVQPVIKFQRTVDALKQMQYAAVAFGPDDLRLPVGELFASVADQNQDGDTPFISANVAMLDESFTPRYRVVTVGAKKIGVTSVLGDEHRDQLQSDEMPMESVAAGLGKVWPQLAAERCDVYLLLAHASLAESAEIARQFPHFDFIITAGGAGEPTHEPEAIENLPAGAKTKMIQVGTKGMYVGVLGVFEDAQRPFRYQRVPLSDRYADAPEMRQLMRGYQDQLEAAGLEGLELRPLPHPSGHKFVGSEQCGDCHTQAYAIWKNSPHAHATHSLTHPRERGDIARHFDPECLSCHVTGWNPQKYYPYVSGYLSLEATPHQVNTGCESCHGPGSAHVAAELGEEAVNETEQLARRAAMALPLDRAERHCMECHDLDNSPDFHDDGAFQKYWKRIEHVGKD